MRGQCFCFFFFNDTATTEIYTLSLHDALPIFAGVLAGELYRRLNALGAGVAEEYFIEVSGLGEEFGDLRLDGDLVQVGAVGQIFRLLLDRLDERRVAVA